jgi:hypothetical protein
MIVDPGITRDSYPLRQTAPSAPARRLHSLRLRTADIRQISQLYETQLQLLNTGDSTTSTRTHRHFLANGDRLDPVVAAREFARFSIACSNRHQHAVGTLHVESAYGLLHRQVEVIPNRVDRVLCSGMAAVALASAGMQVHIVLDSGLGIEYVRKYLAPVLEDLGFGVQCVVSGMDQEERRQAYQQDITIVTSRECAMDFLRDAVNWQQRGNPALRKVDRLMGGRSNQRTNIMRGLPCAVFLDIDYALVDNARAPVALTRDAHPMHEVEELRQALEMVGHLQPGRHYTFTGEAAEVEFTELGRRQLDAWAEQLGGKWGIRHVAELMLAIAITSVHLVTAGTHYGVSRKSIEWLVDDRLVPGMGFYSRPFLTRMVELKEKCEVSSQREVAARASYQQIFNNYVHLSGTCHTSEDIEEELRKIYGLQCSHRWQAVAPFRFDEEYLCVNAEEKAAWLLSWAASDAHHARLLIANDAETLAGLKVSLAALSPQAVDINSTQQYELAEMLSPGSVLLCLAADAEYLAMMMTVPIDCPVEIAVIQRSVRRCEDLRNLSWLQSSPFSSCRKMLVLAKDDEVLAPSSTTGIQTVLRLLNLNGRKLSVEATIRQTQREKAREFFRVRQGLLNHDKTMDGLLSFSGRGLYE